MAPEVFDGFLWSIIFRHACSLNESYRLKNGAKHSLLIFEFFILVGRAIVAPEAFDVLQ